MITVWARQTPHWEAAKLPSIFLAGPSPREAGNYSWRPEAVECLQQLGFGGVVYIPLPQDGGWSDDYDAQFEWELTYLDEAWVVAFWVPRDLVRLPGFTTNVEFGRLLDSGKIVLGYPQGAPKMRYLHLCAQKQGVPVSHTLMGTMQETLRLLSV